MFQVFVTPGVFLFLNFIFLIFPFFFFFFFFFFAVSVDFSNREAVQVHVTQEKKKDT